MITFQKYVKAETLEEAYSLNQAKNNKILGGMLWLRLGNASYNTVIDLSNLGLDQIEETDTEFKIGAMVSLRALEMHEGLNTYTQGAISDAVKDIIGVQFRNLATVGGSIFGRFGFSDVLTVLLSLDTSVSLYKGGTVSLSEFSKMKKDRDILTHIIIKKVPVKCVYSAVRIQRTDFPVLTCCTSVLDGKVNTVIGARPEKALVFTDEKNVLANGFTDEAISTFAKELAELVPTHSNNRGSSAYRTKLVKVLTERNLKKLGGMI